MSRILVCLVLALFASGSLSAPTDVYRFGPETRIVGGIVAPVEVHTWLVSLRANNFFGTQTHRCGASIVTSTWLVTAAHCLPGIQISAGVLAASFRAWSGTNLLNSGGNQHVGIRSISHPDYTGPLTVKNDIGLIEVQPISFGNLVTTITINFNQFIGGGAPVTVAGWGAAVNQGPVQNVLRQHNTHTLTTNQCITSRNNAIIQHPQWSHAPFIDGNIELCTFHSVGQGVCQGDSGSPLVLDSNGQQVGVVSWGFPCAIGGPDVYVRISAYTAWISSFVPGVSIL